jgi:hypothetical protein
VKRGAFIMSKLIVLALTNGTYDFVQVLLVSVIVAVFVIVIGEVALPKKTKADQK